MSTEEYSAVQEIAESYHADLADADEVLREICQAGRRATFAELTFFQRRCGWDETAVRKQLRRMNSILRLQSIAGTSTDREASAKHFDTAAVVLEKEGPKIREKIANDQKRLDALERDARLAEKRVEEQRQAEEQLRALVPDHIRESVRSAVQAIEESIGREILDGEIRLQELKACLTPSLYPNEQTYLETLERSFRAAVLRGESDQMIKRRLSPQWPTIKAEIERELTELQSKLAELKPQYDEQMEQAEKPLSFYAR